MSDEERVTNAETQLASFFAKYEPAMAKLGKALRAKLRARLPGLFEIVYVYENQNALVISYSPTEHGYEGLCSIALYPRCVKLFFAQGALLSKSDPNKLLQGRGKTVRHVVLNAVADFDRAEIEVLMAAASKLAKLRLDARMTFGTAATRRPFSKTSNCRSFSGGSAVFTYWKAFPAKNGLVGWPRIDDLGPWKGFGRWK